MAAIVSDLKGETYLRYLAAQLGGADASKGKPRDLEREMRVMGAAAAGAVVGNVVFPVVGGLIGGAIGAFFGNRSFDANRHSTHPSARSEESAVEASQVQAVEASNNIDISAEEIKVLDDVVVYLRRYLEQNPDNYLASDIYPSSLIADFEAALRARGVANTEEVVEILRTLALSDKASVEIFNAVDELRTQYHGERVSLKVAYSNTVGNPVEFLLKNYGEEIRSGKLGSGQLQLTDPNLYKYASAELKGQGKTIGELFEEQRQDAGRAGSNVARRARAAATILNTSEVEAAKFFRSLHPERVRAPEEKKIERAR